MKRLLPFIPIILLFLVNSCTGINAPETNPTAAAAMSQVAASWTPTPVPTANPNIPSMINVLNTDLYTTNALGWVLDAQYYVIDVSYPPVPNGSPRIIQVDIECICMNETDCCVPERTFVMFTESMKRSNGKISLQVFDGVENVMVVCFDHNTKEQKGAMSASWQDIYGYLQGSVTGQLLGVRAQRTKVP